MRPAARNTPTVYQVRDCPCFLCRCKGKGRDFRAKVCLYLQDDGDDDAGRDRGSFLWSGKGAGQQEKKIRLVKAALYAVQVFYSFFIM